MIYRIKYADFCYYFRNYMHNEIRLQMIIHIIDN
jgi:hypothetical protein